MDKPVSVVFVVDDDRSIRLAIASLLRSAGLRVRCFASAGDFLSSSRWARTDLPACLVLDVRLPGASGLDLQHELAAMHISIPIIFITGHPDLSTTVRAMKAGAVEFLAKPFQDDDLLDAVAAALKRAQEWLRKDQQTAMLRARFEQLTARQRQVLVLVVEGRLNKQIAGLLGITEVTVKIHRARAMHKMRASSLPELVRMAERLGVPGER